jgi:hypothetical protein
LTVVAFWLFCAITCSPNGWPAYTMPLTVAGQLMPFGSHTMGAVLTVLK